MDPEEMTDEQLCEDRTVVSCFGAKDGSYHVLLSCGHRSIWVMKPPVSMKCAQCVNVLVDRARARQGR